MLRNPLAITTLKLVNAAQWFKKEMSMRSKCR